MEALQTVGWQLRALLESAGCWLARARLFAELRPRSLSRSPTPQKAPHEYRGLSWTKYSDPMEAAAARESNRQRRPKHCCSSGLHAQSAFRHAVHAIGLYLLVESWRTWDGNALGVRCESTAEHEGNLQNLRGATFHS